MFFRWRLQWGFSRRPAILRLLLGSAFLLLVGTASAAADEEPDWTVLTVARNGAWGLASASFQSEAIATALRRCRARSAEQSDCGAELVAFRRGCALAILCGDHRIIVAARDFSDAEAIAHDRILSLKSSYGPELPPCRALLRIDPNGNLTTFKIDKPAPLLSSKCHPADCDY